MKGRIAKQAYDKGYDHGAEDKDAGKPYKERNPYKPSHSWNSRQGFYVEGYHDGYTGRARKISEDEAHERERTRVRALEAFRSAVLDAFARGHIFCECVGILHDDGCPLGTLEVEADAIRQKDTEVRA